MNPRIKNDKSKPVKSIKYSITLLLALLLFTNTAFAVDASSDYRSSAQCFHNVKTLPQDEQSRAKWFGCIKLLDAVAKKYPGSSQAENALFSSGLAYRNIWNITNNETDAKDSIEKFRELVMRYPKSNLADDALFNVANIWWEVFKDQSEAEKSLGKILRYYPDGDMAVKAKDYLKSMGSNEPEVTIARPLKDQKAQLIKLVRKVDGNNEKVFLTFSNEVASKLSHSKYHLEGYTLFTLDLENTKLKRNLDTGDYSYVGQGVIRDLFVSQKENGLARLSIVVRNGNQCDAITNSVSIVINCVEGMISKKGEKKEGIASAKKSSKVDPKTDLQFERASIEPTSVATKTQKKVRTLRIVIDPGHGGKDNGAVGKNGTLEKAVTLQIAKRLGWQLRNRLGMDVYYTRIDDTFVSLDERNRIAVSQKADLFISIHANAAESDQLTGYQTFYLNNATDEASRRLAARENASLGKNMDDVEKIVLTLMQNVNTDESSSLARSIHRSVLSRMSKYGLKDRGNKSALFYVLVGSRCPAVLIETSFISNAVEEERLKDPDYEEDIVKAISDGVNKYLSKGQPTTNI